MHRYFPLLTSFQILSWFPSTCQSANCSSCYCFWVSGWTNWLGYRDMSQSIAVFILMMLKWSHLQQIAAQSCDISDPSTVELTFPAGDSQWTRNKICKADGVQRWQHYDMLWKTGKAESGKSTVYMGVVMLHRRISGVILAKTWGGEGVAMGKPGRWMCRSRKWRVTLRWERACSEC